MSAGEIVEATRVVPASVDVRRPSASHGGRRATLVHQPALDGLRGLAVAAVVWFHLDHLRGGFLGVDLFFVLSGFLITSLLLTEVASTGGVGLGGFWVRRARRLLPALAIVLVAVALMLLSLTPEAQRGLFRDDALATVGYVANWQRVWSEAGYWDAFSQASPFEHMWSLAIEEQFYLFWPLAVVGLAALANRRRGTSTNGNGDGGGGGSPARRASAAQVVGAVAAVGSVVSLAWLAVSFDPFDSNWAYFSTPTRLGPILGGAALAAWRVGRPERTEPPDVRRQLVAGAALAAAVFLMFDLRATTQGYYYGGLAIFTVASLVVVAAVTGGPQGPLARALSPRPLRYLGNISYGVYLWHVPIIVFATADRIHVGGWWLDAFRVAATLLAATLSYRLVEQPVRHGTLGGRELRVLGAGALAIATVAVVVATAGEPPSVGAADAAPKGLLAGTDNEFLRVPAAVAPDARRLMVVGDSGVNHLGRELVEVASETDVAVAYSSNILCTLVVPEGLVQRADGGIEARKPCHAKRQDVYTRMVDEFDPDVVVYYLANVGGRAHVRLDGQWVSDCDPVYDEYLGEALREDADILSAGGATVVFAAPPDPVTFEEGSGERVDCRGETMRDLAADRPGTAVAELNAFVDREAKAGTNMYADPIHLSPAGATLVSRWLLTQLDGWIDLSAG